MDALSELTKKRMAAMVACSKIGSDAIAKSLRCYDTEIHPIFEERLSCWFDGLSCRCNTVGRTYFYNSAYAGMTGSNVMNCAFHSFYLQEPRDESEIISISISTKTSVTLTKLEGTDMRTEVDEWLKSYNQGDPYEVVSLRALANQELGFAVVHDLLENTRNSTLATGILHLLRENNFRFPCDRPVIVRDRHLPPDLRMNVKYYPARDDNRAYCSDHNRLRSLVGCCLHRMISPKRMTTRLALHTSSILRPDKKDILDLHLPLAPSDDICTHLILADISNFTGSFGNAWLMVFTMGLEIACGNLEDRYQLFGIGTNIVGASWKELLLLYLYLTVGVPCWVEDQSRFAHISGGFLGVGGNISIGLLCLAIILQDVIKRLRPRVWDIRVQAGGDDIALLIQCSLEDLEEISELIRGELDRYIGRVKDYVVLDLGDCKDGALDEVLFCRKRIIMRTTNRRIHLEGEPSVPLPQSLIPSPPIGRKDLQVKAWYDLDNSLRVFENKMQNVEVLTDSLRQLFLDQYREVIPLRVHQERYLTSSHRVLQYDTYLLTDVAHKVVLSIPQIEYHGSAALVNYGAKVRHALLMETLVMIKVNTGMDSSDLVIMSRVEASMLKRNSWNERIHVGFDVALLDDFINIINNV
jgi:hypothetical protein